VTRGREIVPNWIAATSPHLELRASRSSAHRLDVGVGGTPFSGILPFLVNHAPQQLTQAIGAPASPPPLISLLI
jgi:hypothetical protein